MSAKQHESGLASSGEFPCGCVSLLGGEDTVLEVGVFEDGKKKGSEDGVSEPAREVVDGALEGSKHAGERCLGVKISENPTEGKIKGCQGIRERSSLDVRHETDSWLRFRHLKCLISCRFCLSSPSLSAHASRPLFTTAPLDMRRLKLRANSKVYLLRPCFVMPYCTAKVQEVDNALYLRLWGVSFDALAHCFGRSPKFYERCFLALARTNLVASTCKVQLPAHLVADEKHVRTAGQTKYLCVTASQGCILGARLVAQISTQDLVEGYGEFQREAHEVEPSWSPKSVCLDGFRATQASWKQLWPSLSIILCFLHAMLKLRSVSAKKTREQANYQVLMDKAWQVFEAPTRRHFAQRLRRLVDWSQKNVERGKLKHEVQKMGRNSRRYSISYTQEQCYRTSSQVDRLMSHQSHILRSQRGFHGNDEHASQMMRAHAMVWNFHPYGVRLLRNQPERVSPFHDLNGFQYHDNWLCNLLLASSRGGLGRHSHQIRRY